MIRYPNLLSPFLRRLGVALAMTFLLTVGSLAATISNSVSGAMMKESYRGQHFMSTENVLYFVPNDPYYWLQWHLDDPNGLPHVNVSNAWARGLTGAGVTIGIIDTGIETTHPDLLHNYVAEDSFDFGDGDFDPNPVYSDESHGTSVVGIAAAHGGNSLGVTGASPEAGWAGLRVDFWNQTEQMFADATTYHSIGDNPTIRVKNHSYGIRVGYVNREVEAAALVASHDAGTIHVMSAGNSRDWHGYWGDGDTNKKHLLCLPESITVAAVGTDGIFAPYSNWGANVMVAAPSSDYQVGITTTDRQGTLGYSSGFGDSSGDLLTDPDYTDEFGGTSASSPLVAGIMALGIEANPALDTRMAKHLLAQTSRIIDPYDQTETSDGGWKTNGAGYSFNQNYGFGLIDADAFTLSATQYTGVTPLEIESTGIIPVHEQIPDAISHEMEPGTLTKTFELSEPGKLENVEIMLDILHPYRGDLQATLISPSGMSSRLMYRNISDWFGDISWAFVTNAFWGEDPVGEWTLTVEDWYSGDTGIWDSFAISARKGSLIPIPEPSTLWLAALGLISIGLISHRHRSPSSVE